MGNVKIRKKRKEDLSHRKKRRRVNRTNLSRENLEPPEEADLSNVDDQVKDYYRPPIYYCDEPMGSGKTTAALNFIRDSLAENKDLRFLFVTERLSSIDEIKERYPEINFWSPVNYYEEDKKSKIRNTIRLAKAHKNIITSHEAFKGYFSEVLEAFKGFNYIAVIDEAVNVLEESEIAESDFVILKDSGVTKSVGRGEYRSTGKEVELAEDDGRMHDLLTKMRTSYILEVPKKQYDKMITGRAEKAGKRNRDANKKKPSRFIWMIKPDVFTAFKAVIILTYLFEYQDVRAYLDKFHFRYKRIGLMKDGESTWFSENREYIPDYFGHLVDLVSVYEGKLNAIGDMETALSAHDYSKAYGTPRMYSIQKSLRSFRRTVCYDKLGIKANEFIWSCYSDDMDTLTQKGMCDSWVPFNMRGLNSYRNCRAVAYMVNVYRDPCHLALLNDPEHNIDDKPPFSSDSWALSNMVQTVWRARIRNGLDVEVFVPSRRMRRLLRKWLKETQNNYWIWRKNKDEAVANGYRPAKLRVEALLPTEGAA